MAVKNRALRTRVFVAALALGLIVGAQGYFSSPAASSGEAEKSAPISPSGEEPKSPGQAAGLRPAPRPGISFSPRPHIETAWKQSAIRMKYLDACQKSAKCPGFDDSEPYSYDLDVRKQTAREIEDFTRIAVAWQDDHGGELPEEAQKIARYFLETGNDDVKEAALDLIFHAPLTEPNVHAAFRALEMSASGPLATHFLKSDYAKAACGDESLSSMCLSYINHSMRIGGENVQKAVARYSLNISNEKTIETLTAIEKQQNPRSTMALYFRLNREEFQRQQRGG